MAKLPPTFEVTVEKLVFEGEALGHAHDKALFMYGALPGETVEAYPIKVTSKFAKAGVRHVLKANPERREPRDAHYLSCSPWQIMPEAMQAEWKKKTTLEAWQRIAHELPFPDVTLTPSPSAWGYRNKMEFSFCETDGKVSLALHERYGWDKYFPLESCAIAHPRINETAAAIVSFLNENSVAASMLKTLVLRYSYAQDAVLATLYVMTHDFPTAKPHLEHCAGFVIAYSEPRSPASVITEVLAEEGDPFLTENVRDTQLRYRHDGFFQVNPPAFALTIEALKKGLPSSASLVDLYCGVGTIGLCLRDKYPKIVGVEYDARAAEMAEENAKLNDVKDFSFHGIAAEKHGLEGALKAGETLIVDPPRVGLHPDVVAAINEHGPRDFAYLSCNPATQARDWALLKATYEAVSWELFDYYPQTPHVESLLIMKRKA